MDEGTLPILVIMLGVVTICVVLSFLICRAAKKQRNIERVKSRAVELLEAGSGKRVARLSGLNVDAHSSHIILPPNERGNHCIYGPGQSWVYWGADLPATRLYSIYITYCGWAAEFPLKVKINGEQHLYHHLARYPGLMEEDAQRAPLGAFLLKEGYNKICVVGWKAFPTLVSLTIHPYTEECDECGAAVTGLFCVDCGAPAPCTVKKCACGEPVASDACKTCQLTDAHVQLAFKGTAPQAQTGTTGPRGPGKQRPGKKGRGKKGRGKKNTNGRYLHNDYGEYTTEEYDSTAYDDSNDEDDESNDESNDEQDWTEDGSAAEVGASSADLSNDFDVDDGGFDMYGGAGPRRDRFDDDDDASHRVLASVEDHKSTERHYRMRYPTLQDTDALRRALDVVSMTVHASDTLSEDDVEVVTQCSLDRLDRLVDLCVAWRGPVSAAVYLDPATDLLAGPLAARTVNEAVRLARAAGASLAVSVVTEPSRPEELTSLLYPINALRNVALRQASRPRVFLLDVDFVPSEGLHAYLRANPGLGGQDSAYLVVPAFEISPDTALPAHKRGMKACCELKKAGPFRVDCFPWAHRPTNYSKWGTAADVYSVSYSPLYEPYVVAPRMHVPTYDERFAGYGMNKVVHLRAAHAMGASFEVAPAHFVVARAHEASAAWKDVFGKSDGIFKQAVSSIFSAAMAELDQGDTAASAPLSEDGETSSTGSPPSFTSSEELHDQQLVGGLRFRGHARSSLALDVPAAFAASGEVMQ